MESNAIIRDRIWSDVIRRSTGVKIPEVSPMPSIRTMARNGWAYRAIVEAHDGEKAMKAKSARLGRLLGMEYLLLTEAIQLNDEAELMMDNDFRAKNGFKASIKKMESGFEEFYNNIVGHISPDEMKRFSQDLKAFDENVRSYANLAGYKVATKEDERKCIHDRIINLHKDFLDKLQQLKEEHGEQALKDIMDEIKGMEV